MSPIAKMDVKAPFAKVAGTYCRKYNSGCDLATGTITSTGASIQGIWDD